MLYALLVLAKWSASATFLVLSSFGKQYKQLLSYFTVDFISTLWLFHVVNGKILFHRFQLSLNLLVGYLVIRKMTIRTTSLEIFSYAHYVILDIHAVAYSFITFRFPSQAVQRRRTTRSHPF